MPKKNNNNNNKKQKNQRASSCLPGMGWKGLMTVALHVIYLLFTESPRLEKTSKIFQPSHAPILVPIVKLSQWALPAPELGSVSPFQTGKIHLQPSCQMLSKLHHGQKNSCDCTSLSAMCLWDGFSCYSVSFPAPKGIEENMTCTLALSTNPDVLFDNPQASLTNFITASLNYPSPAQIRLGSLLETVHTEAAHIPAGRVGPTYTASQQGVTYDNHPSVLMRTMSPHGWTSHCILTHLSLKFQSLRPITYLLKNLSSLDIFTDLLFSPWVHISHNLVNLQNFKRSHKEAFQYLNGAYKQEEDCLFTQFDSDRIRQNGFKLNEGRFRLAVRKTFFTQRAMKHWHRLLRDVVGLPPLEALKARLDRAPGSLSWWVSTSPWQGSWNWVISKVPSNLSHSMNLWFCMTWSMWSSYPIKFVESNSVCMNNEWMWLIKIFEINQN